MIVVSDTTPISSLILIEKMSLLQMLFGTMSIPRAVAEELNKKTIIQHYLAQSDSWIQVSDIQDKAKFQLLRGVLDAGESEAIVLAGELKADILLMDERKGQRVAQEHGLQTTGTIGILLKAKEAGHIASVKEPLLALKYNTDFWIADSLIASVLQLANEE